MRKMLLAVLAVTAVGALLAAGCGNTTTQGKAPSTKAVSDTSANAENVTVQAISSNPTAYDGRIVTTEGNYAVGYCSACFLLKDGVASVRCEVSDTAPLPPESKLTSRMRVTGKVYVVKGSPNIISEKIEYL
jgi:uncharacterized protein YdeI (BOF family)